MTLFQYRKSFLNLSIVALAAVLFSLVGLVKADTLEEECDPFGCYLICYFDEGGGISSSNYEFIISICDVTEKEEVAAPADEPDTVTCSTRTTSMEMTDRRTVVIYGTAADGTAGTLFIAEIPLSSIRNITEDVRASGEPIWITSYDSTIVEGWHIDIYWQNEHYGAHIVGNGGSFVDDTGATCF
jgi:hypothetical protein